MPPTAGLSAPISPWNHSICLDERSHPLEFALRNPAFALLSRKNPDADPAIDDHSTLGTIAISPASAKKG
jgi:hypothetical protein